jgi:hypothetical protein
MALVPVDQHGGSVMAQENSAGLRPYLEQLAWG